MKPATAVTFVRILVALVAISLVACGGRQPTDELDAARRAVEGAADSERCAEAEYRAARNLLEQANEAFEARDYGRARQLADAAALQAERARQLAIENAEECDRRNNMTDQVTELQDTRRQPTPIDTDYEWVAVFFDFDQSSITPQGRAILDRHAEQMVANQEYRMTVEGHCDSRGSIEYNLALGERRARTVEEYLVLMGVDGARIRTVSYGAEMPVASDWNRNRRAEFRIHN